ncbi:MAG TPA: DinB family protein [Pyrinomonadaceae bacterium]|nr:DinB family protein [Pyrinomonadaceae bacterium]
MSQHLKWGQRTFDFNFPVEVFPEMIERIRGTPARLEDRIAELSTETLTRRHADRWSIQENAGHLLDIEELFSRRLDEYLSGAPTLHAADMSNKKTFAADHNSKPVQTILSAFRSQRGRLVHRFEDLPPAAFGNVSHHPRLDKPMRLVDMLFFQAEHDDYHLARISELIRES